jgi:hypothetical protein
MKKYIILLLAIAGCRDTRFFDQRDSFPIMSGKVISKSDVSGYSEQPDRIFEGKLIKGGKKYDEAYQVEILNPQGHRLRQRVSKEVYDQIQIGQELQLQ